MITKIGTNRKRLVLGIQILLIPVFTLGSFLFFNHDTNKKVSDSEIVSGEQSPVSDDSVIAQEELCPVTEDDSYYLYVGCNGFF